MTKLSFIKRAFVRLQLPAILWALVIFTGSSIPAEDFPDLSILAYDKVFHFLLFGLFCYFLYRALQNQNRYPRLALHAPWAAFSVTILYGVFDEVHQVFVPGRSPDLLDLLADSLGALTAIVILLVLARARSRNPA